MRGQLHAGALLLAVALCTLIDAVGALSKISRSGKYLYDDSGNRFYIKGIAYQEQGTVVSGDDNAFGEPSTFIDPLSSGDACSRDLPYLQELGVNAVRVYSVNSSLNHDSCMSTFSNAGIYTIIDLSLPLNGSIDRVSPSWSTNILDQYLRTIDTFAKYDNVLAYNIGNEVIIGPSTSWIASYVKAAARDVKSYLKSKSSSALVGYSAINGASSWIVPLAEFLSCDVTEQGADGNAIDLYGLNDYSWCGNSSYDSSFKNTNEEYADYNVAAYFSEFGCITSPPRLWTETGSLFSSQMSDVWSGGIAFSYFPAESVQGQFGMVEISSDGKSVTTSDDFDRLKTQYGQISPPNSPSSGSNSYPSCEDATSSFNASTTLPPTPNEDACNCVLSELSCRFNPPTANYSVILGTLVDQACVYVGEAGGSCDPIGGGNGTYGLLSSCDPTIKLSYVMSENYELNNMNTDSCYFAGNGTVNTAASSAVDSVASSCISSPTATFTPSAPPLSTDTSSGGGSGSGDDNNNDDGGDGASSLSSPIVCLFTATIFALAGASWTLL